LDLELDPSQLANIAQSYVYDLGRYVKFHEVQIPDRARRGAYICKWVIKLKPIHHRMAIETLSPEQGEMLLLANELYAMYVLSATIKIDLEKKLAARMGNILLYSLRYRAASEDSFILFLAHLFLSEPTPAPAK
jgi:hypothetical protein